MPEKTVCWTGFGMFGWAGYVKPSVSTSQIAQKQPGGRQGPVFVQILFDVGICLDVSFDIALTFITVHSTGCSLHGFMPLDTVKLNSRLQNHCIECA